VSLASVKKQKEHLGEKIKRLRAFRGMTQEELAEALGKTRSLVSFLERTGKVNKYTLQEISGILKTTPDELEAGITLEEDSQPAYSTTNSEELIDQLRKEISFLKETINNQWQLLKELSKNLIWVEI
jgi:transcriptional regulator with XRE-family HTH domain